MTTQDEITLAIQQHGEKFLVLLKAGIFDEQSGSAQIIINMHNGQVQTVHIDRMTYKRGSDKV